MKDEEYFAEAAKEANKSLCKKAKCGAVIVLGGEIVGRGYNAPPNDDIKKSKCDCEFSSVSMKPKSDRTCCVHAEWRAIIDGVRRQGTLEGSSLYFTRVDEGGAIVRSGKPYCTVCSRLALDTGIEYFFLWHDDGIKGYEAEEYNDLSYLFHQNS